MPFGISPAPEIFQRRRDAAIQNLPEVYTVADDILVIGKGATQQAARNDYDSKIIQLLNRRREKGLKLNQEKCKIAMPHVAYMGHIPTDNELKTRPCKVTAIQKIQTPQDRPGVTRLMRMVSYLSKFVGNLSDLCKPLRQLTKQDVKFCWTTHMMQFERIKQQ